MKKVVNVSDTDLKSVVEEVAKTGQEIVLGDGDKPVARLVPVPNESSQNELSEEEKQRRSRRLGCFAGQIWMADDFDEWPEEEARALGIIDDDEDDAA